MSFSKGKRQLLLLICSSSLQWLRLESKRWARELLVSEGCGVLGGQQV